MHGMVWFGVTMEYAIMACSGVTIYILGMERHGLHGMEWVTMELCGMFVLVAKQHYPFKWWVGGMDLNVVEDLLWLC
jgi:hypothetical protein